MKLYLEDPTTRMRYGLVPPIAGERADWIQEYRPCHVVYEGPRGQVEPELTLGGVSLRRFERDVGQELIVKWEWKPDFYAGRISVALQSPAGPLFVDTIILNPAEDKLTRDRYDLMVAQIFEQAETCFKISPAKRHVALGRKVGDRWLAHLEFARRYSKEISHLLERLVSSPHKKLERFTEIVSLDADIPCAFSHEWVVSAGAEYLRQAGSGWSLPGYGLGYSLSDVEVARTTVSVDTYENRFVLQFLHSLHKGLVGTLHALRKAKSIGQDQSLLRIAVADAERFLREIDTWLRLPLFQVVGRTAAPQRGSHVLVKHPLYSRLYQLWSRFRRIPDAFDGELMELPLEKTWQLYEYWCYMMVVRCLNGLGLIEDASGLFRVEDSPGKVSLALVQGEGSKVLLKGGHSLYFHRKYQVVDEGVGTGTIEMQPDICIESVRHGELRRVVVLDPKYRVSSKSIGEAIKDLHSYCHAICRFPRRRQLVALGVVLAPTDDHRIFRHGFGDRVGIEGIQLMPGDESTVRAMMQRLSRLLEWS